MRNRVFWVLAKKDVEDIKSTMKVDWPAIVENLQKTLDPGVFKVWISPLDGEVRDASVCLTAPNDFAADWIRERLACAIRKAASGVLGFPPDAISLLVRSENVAPAERIVISPTESVARSRPEQGVLIGPASPHPSPRWRFSFEDFVVGPSNEVAYAAAKGLCAGLADTGTLFVSAASGLGKTHLVQAVGKYLSESEKCARHRISCLSAEEFASCFVAALKARDVESFKTRLRQSDVLLLEDVHFLQNKGKMQEEALALIKSLQSKGSRLVLTSSFAPRELRHIDGQLVSLFCSGWLAHMASPTLETRRDILREKARIQQALLPEPVSELLATRITSDVRQLESCLNNLIFKARLLNRQICLDMALEMIGQYADTQLGLDMAAIIRLVCDSFKLSETRLASRSRKSEYVQARNTVYYLARKHTQLSLQEIGDRFNRRHSSVIKGLSVFEREMQRESALGRRLTHAVELIERNAGV